jgi:hypothetical protein
MACGAWPARAVPRVLPASARVSSPSSAQRATSTPASRVLRARGSTLRCVPCSAPMPRLHLGMHARELPASNAACWPREGYEEGASENSPRDGLGHPMMSTVQLNPDRNMGVNRSRASLARTAVFAVSVR